MTCTWCPNEATEGGRLPANAKGKRFWPACAAHANKIDALKLIRISVRDIAEIQKREAQEAKAGK